MVSVRPGGIGINHLGDVFYCDNQGLWNGSSSLKHLRLGGFQGNPTGNKYFALTDALGPNHRNRSQVAELKSREKITRSCAPPVVLPHGKVGNSPAGIECDETNGKFGPFKNQLFVSDKPTPKSFAYFLRK